MTSLPNYLPAFRVGLNEGVVSLTLPFRAALTRCTFNNCLAYWGVGGDCSCDSGSLCVLAVIAIL